MSSFSQMNDYSAAAAAAAAANPDMWAMNQQMPPQNMPDGTNSQLLMMNQQQMHTEQPNFMMQPNNFYNNGASSSNSSPLASPSMSVNSMSDSDTTGGYQTGSVMYPVNPPVVGPNDTGVPFTNAAPAEPAYNNNNNNNSPPYPSAPTDSSSGEGGTSPDDDFNYNDGSFQTSPQDNIKQEDKSGDKKSKSVKKLAGAKLNPDSKSSKVTKPRKEKTSHNMIEKRYRTNINDKILALRDCVPSLRCVVDGGPQQQNLDLEGLTPASKLNKATVLTKATEYILHLQKRNQMLMEQLHEMRQGRPVDMQMMMDMNGMPPAMPAYPHGHPGMPPQNNGYASKAMMLSMAGIMGAGLMGDGSDMQGLAALPFFSFLSSASIGPWNVHSLLFAFKFLLVAGTILYLVVPSLFDSSSPSKTLEYSPMDEDVSAYSLREMRRQTWLTNTRSLDIPRETLSSQGLSFVKSMAQIILINVFGSDSYEMLANNFEKDQTNMRRVSLARAIDAQLCGGDEGSSTRGRLFYTFVKSFILPATPARYLTQSIHVSVLLHDLTLLAPVGAYLSKWLWNKARTTREPTSTPEDDETVLGKNTRALLDSTSTISPEIVQRLAFLAYGRPLSEGHFASEEDEGYVSIASDKSLRSVIDILTALHANALLHDVLIGVLESEETDLKTLELCADIAPPRSVVTRRVAIAQALLLGPKDATYAKTAMEMLKEELDQQDWVSHKMAMDNTHSVGSHSRSSSHANTSSGPASRVRTIFEDDEDSITFSSSSSSIMSDDSFSVSDSESISTERGEEVAFLSSAVKTSTTPFIVSQDSRLGIRCALITCYLARSLTGPAFTLIQNIEINKLENIGLLGFVAMWKVLGEIYEKKYIVNRNKLEDLSAVARVWLGGNAGAQEGLSLPRLRELVGESVQMSKFFGGYECEVDEGYGTQ